MVVCTNLTLLGTTVFDEYSDVAGEKALGHCSFIVNLCQCIVCLTSGATENEGQENAGLENAAPDCRGGKRGTGKRGTRLQGWKTRE